MVDRQVEGVPAEVVERIDAAARRSGLSRAAYLRRGLLNAAVPTGDRLTKRDLVRFAQTFADLDDGAVTDRAPRSAR